MSEDWVKQTTVFIGNFLTYPADYFGVSVKGIEPVKLSIRLPSFNHMPELGLQYVRQSDVVAE